MSNPLFVQMYYIIFLWCIFSKAEVFGIIVCGFFLELLNAHVRRLVYMTLENSFFIFCFPVVTGLYFHFDPVSLHNSTPYETIILAVGGLKIAGCVIFSCCFFSILTFSKLEA